MGRKKLSCNGFWMYSRFLKRHLENLGAEFPGGVPQAMDVAHTEWTKLSPEDRRQWKLHAKAYKKTDEFKRLQRHYKRLHANSPSRPNRREGGRRRSDSDVDSDEWVEVVEWGGDSEDDDEGVELDLSRDESGAIGPDLEKLFQAININKVTFAFDSVDLIKEKQPNDNSEKSSQAQQLNISRSPTSSDYSSLEIPSARSEDTAEPSKIEVWTKQIDSPRPVMPEKFPEPIPAPAKMSYAAALKRK